MSKLESKVPNGPLADKWTNHKSNINLVSPANKRLIDIIVVGTGLAGASASATLAELARLQIIQQAGNAMLAQANAQPQSVLALLQ